MTGPHGDTNLLEHLLARPVRECTQCGGEGYSYVENAGRHAEHPVIELKCRACGGTGVKP